MILKAVFVLRTKPLSIGFDHLVNHTIDIFSKLSDVQNSKVKIIKQRCVRDTPSHEILPIPNITISNTGKIPGIKIPELQKIPKFQYVPNTGG